MTFEDIFPLILIFGVLSFVLIMNQRRTKQQSELQNSVVEGDEVVLHSGVYGFVASVEPDVLWLEVSEGTEIKVSKAAIQTVLSATD